MKILKATALTMTLALGALSAQAETQTSATQAEEAPAAPALRSETHFRAQAGEWVITPKMSYEDLNGKLKGGDGDIGEFGTVTSISAEIGWTSNLSTELVLGLKEFDLNPAQEGISGTKEGLTDLRVTLKGELPLNAQSGIHYGAHIKASPESSVKTETLVKVNELGQQDIEVETSAHTSGQSATVFLGYQSTMGPGMAGVKLTQTIWGAVRKGEDTQTVVTPLGTNSSTSKYEEKGGGVSRINAFYEWALMDQLSLGFRGEYELKSHVVRKYAGQEHFKGRTENVQFIGLSIYPTYKLNSNISVLASVDYNSLVGSNIKYAGADLESGEELSMGMGLRASF